MLRDSNLNIKVCSKYSLVNYMKSIFMLSLKHLISLISKFNMSVLISSKSTRVEQYTTQDTYHWAYHSFLTFTHPSLFIVKLYFCIQFYSESKQRCLVKELFLLDYIVWILDAIEQVGGIYVATADHGNVEDMVKRNKSGQPLYDKNGNLQILTSHTCLPVSFQNL